MPTILLVDDQYEKLEPQLTAAALEHGHALQCTRSPEEAIETLQQSANPFGFIVLDLHFENSLLQGSDAVEAIHAAAPKTNIFVLADDGDTSVANECLELGARCYWPRQRLDMERLVGEASRICPSREEKVLPAVPEKPTQVDLPVQAALPTRLNAGQCPAIYRDEFLGMHRATFALRLQSVGVPEKDLEDHRVWMRKMLAALQLPVPGRSLQLRYQSTRKDDGGYEFQIWILGFGWGDDAGTAHSRSEHLWSDVASFLKIAEHLYIMEPSAEEANIRNLLSVNESESYSRFEILRSGRTATFSPPKQPLSSSPSSTLKQSLFIPFHVTENMSTRTTACEFMRRQKDSCTFVVNLHPARLSDDLADYLGTLRRAIAAKWDVSTGPALQPNTHPAGLGELEVLANNLTAMQQCLSTHFEITCCAVAGSQLVGQTLANLFAGEFLGSDVCELRAISSDRAVEICGGGTEPTLNSDFLTHRYTLSEAQRIFCLPVPVKESVPGIKTILERFAFVPEDLPTDGVILGHKTTAEGEIMIHFPDHDRMKHLYMLGLSGIGKSSTLYRLIKQDIEAGHGVCLMDPHGDLAESILSIIPDERLKDVVLIEPADIAHPVGINVMDWDRNNPAERSFITDEMLRIFEILYNMPLAGGPQFEMYFRSAMSLAMASPDHPACLRDIVRIFADNDFRKELLERTTNTDVKRFWEQIAPYTSGDQSLSNFTPYITSKFDRMMSNEHLAPILNVTHSSIDFTDILNGRKILILNAGKAVVGLQSAQMLGMIVVAKLLTAAMRRVRLPEAKRIPFFLYIDEFQNFTTDSIFEMAAEGRKFGIALHLANQSLAQMEANRRDTLLGSISTVLSFRLGPADAAFISPYVGPRFNGRDLLDIPNYSAIARLSNRAGVAHPFFFQAADAVPPRDDKRVAQIRKICHERQAIAYAADKTKQRRQPRKSSATSKKNTQD